MFRTFGATLTCMVALTLGCYSAPVMPPAGLLYTRIEAPVSPAVEGQAIGSRSGESSSQAVLGIFAWGDASVAAAVTEGDISEPQHIDYEYFNVLGVYQKFTTIVHGE